MRAIDFVIIKGVNNEDDHLDPHIGAGFIPEAVGFEGDFYSHKNIIDEVVESQVVTGICFHRIESFEGELHSDDLFIVVLPPINQPSIDMEDKLVVATTLAENMITHLGGSIVQSYKANIGFAFRVRGYDRSIFDNLVSTNNRH